MEKPQIGVQTSISGGIHNAVKEQIEKGGTCGQIFSHSPQSWDEPSPSDEEIEEFSKLCSRNDVQPWIIHASYLVNLCTPKDALGNKSRDSMQAELDVAKKIGIPFINVHLGAHTGAGVEQGLRNAAERIDSLDVPNGLDVVIESDAGSGTKLGGNIEHLARMQELTDTHLKFCVDTAHSFAAGYDISSKKGVEEMFNEFDELVGLEDLEIIHLNDSKHECDTNKDEHEHLGQGEIGQEGIEAVVRRAGNMNLTMIAETPITEERGDEENIQMVKDALDGY